MKNENYDYFDENFLEKLEKEIEKPEFIEIQHQKGKLTARERISLLFDSGTFFELDKFSESRAKEFGMEKKKVLGDAVICGFGKIEGRQVFVFSQDFSKIGGTLGEAHAKKIQRVYQLARKTGCPIIGIYDSGGARIQEGVLSLEGYGAIFREQVLSSGVIPQISLVLGPSAGGACYAPALSDFVFMVDKISFMFITGPEVIKKVLGEEISFEDLGGAKVQSEKSGVCHLRFENEENCFLAVKKLLSYLPQNYLEEPPFKKGLFSDFLEKEETNILKILPKEKEKTYDIKEIISEIFDSNSFFEISPEFAQNAVVGFARLKGRVVGIVANQPKILAGTLDISASDKIARFVRFCDCFNIPIISLVDCPGYLPGKDQEHQGIIRHGAKILYAFAEAQVPKIALVLRKAFGGAYIALASKSLGFDFTFAFPFSQIGVLGPEQAVKIIFKKEISENPQIEKEKILELEKMQSAFEAAKLGIVEIIDPKNTRKVLSEALESLKDKVEQKIKKKHGNIPL
jgi:acetyl-CoA carboxylase carboxyltransferase component